MSSPYDVERALREGLAWSDGIEPGYPTRRALLRALWPVLVLLLAAGAVIAAYAGMWG